MKTRREDGGEPLAGEPWNEVRPGLWMGGHVWADRTGEVRAAVVDREFDLVISLFTRVGHGPDPSVRHLVRMLPDAPLTAGQIDAVQELARTATDAVRTGRTVLVRCHSGYNRSGLVVAESLIGQGLEPAAAIELVRRRRSPRALNNRIFEEYLTTGLDVARLLSGLEESG
ncbi:protein phosphatase [Streptomyces sp. NPDC006670]|uniref:protein-tyrosine phosphatase family protein n=1 Tax=Streptomyces sp. NPDC006670 TaxID=3154476 RepID=UPI0033EC7C9B